MSNRSSGHVPIKGSRLKVFRNRLHAVASTSLETKVCRDVVNNKGLAMKVQLLLNISNLTLKYLVDSIEILLSQQIFYQHLTNTENLVQIIL